MCEQMRENAKVFKKDYMANRKRSESLVCVLIGHISGVRLRSQILCHALAFLSLFSSLSFLAVFVFFVVFCFFFSFFQNANFSFVFTSFNIFLVHLAMKFTVYVAG